MDMEYKLVYISWAPDRMRDVVLASGVPQY